MPSRNTLPRPAFLGGFDARPWASTQVFTRLAASISLPAETAIRPDALDMLNGRRCQTARSLTGELVAGWTGGATTIQADIHPTLDRVFIHSTSVAFKAQASVAGDVWGCGLSQISSAPGAHPITGVAGHLLVFPGEWTRGSFSLGETRAALLITPVGGGAAFAVPAQSTYVQGVVTMLRTHVLSDLDTPLLATLEDRDCAAVGSTEIRWGINNEGHVFCSRPSGLLLSILVWTSTTFRDRLGFLGTEVDVVGPSGELVLTAALPCPGVLVPTRPLRRGLERETVDTTRTFQLVSGDIDPLVISSWTRWHVEGLLDGPADLRDLADHWVSRCWGVSWYQGARMTIIPEWGDGRRRITSLAGPTYSTLYTSQDNRGRVLGRICAEMAASRRCAWGSGMRRALPYEMQIQEGP